MNRSEYDHDIKQVKYFVAQICHARISKFELEQFANICLRFAVAHLRVMAQRGYRIRETDNGTEWQGIAADCIAELFIRNREGRLVYMTRYFNLRKLDFDGVEDAFIALRQLISRKVQQHMTRIYRERDPEGAKLLRNLRLATRRHNELQLIKNSFDEYIQYLPPGKIFSETAIVYRPDYFEVKHAAINVLNARLTIDQMVLLILKTLSESSSQIVEVAVQPMVTLIRNWRSSIEFVQYSKSDLNSEHDFYQIAFRKKILHIIEKLTKKISNNYVNKNKLTLVQGLAMVSALQDIANDALDGERLRENFSYLKQHWPFLTREKYMKSTRKMFEYFVRQFKDEIRKEIRDFSE